VDGEPKRTTLDLRGEVCPYTFVRAKLALEDEGLEVGDELELILDHPPAWFSLPRALREEGHEVLHVEPLPKTGDNDAQPQRQFIIRARKRPLLPGGGESV
jgi:tRNA 2-thiouridine synthesizing protein A